MCFTFKRFLKLQKLKEHNFFSEIIVSLILPLPSIFKYSDSSIILSLLLKRQRNLALCICNCKVLICYPILYLLLIFSLYSPFCTFKCLALATVRTDTSYFILMLHLSNLTNWKQQLCSHLFVNLIFTLEAY